MNTLRGTKTTFLTPEMYKEHHRPFIRELSPGESKGRNWRTQNDEEFENEFEFGSENDKPE